MFLHYETEIKKSQKLDKKEMLGHKVVVAKVEGCCLDAITKILKKVPGYTKATLFEDISAEYFDRTGICFDEILTGEEVDAALIEMLTGDKRVKVLPFALHKALMPNEFIAKAICDDEDEYSFEVGKKLADTRLAKKLKASEKKAINSWLLSQEKLLCDMENYL